MRPFSISLLIALVVLVPTFVWGQPSGTPPPPSTRPEAPRLEPVLTPDVVEQIVHSHMRRIRACQERALRHDPQAAFPTAFAFTVRPDGHVVDVELDPAAPGRAGECLRREIASWVFPAPGASLCVRQSLTSDATL